MANTVHAATIAANNALWMFDAVMSQFQQTILDLLTVIYARTGIGITPSELTFVALSVVVVLLMFSDV